MTDRVAVIVSCQDGGCPHAKLGEFGLTIGCKHPKARENLGPDIQYKAIVDSDFIVDNDFPEWCPLGKMTDIESASKEAAAKIR